MAACPTCGVCQVVLARNVGEIVRERDEARARVAELEGQLRRFMPDMDAWDDLPSRVERSLIAHQVITAWAYEAEARLAELEAAAKPRPMSEAPRDGTRIHMVDLCSWSEADDSGSEGWSEHGTVGWLPLSDERNDRNEGE